MQWIGGKAAQDQVSAQMAALDAQIAQVLPQVASRSPTAAVVLQHPSCSRNSGHSGMI